MRNLLWEREREREAKESQYSGAHLFSTAATERIVVVRTDDKGLLGTGDRRGEVVRRTGVGGGLGGGRRGRGRRGETKRVQSEPAEMGHTRWVHYIPHSLSFSLSVSLTSGTSSRVLVPRSDAWRGVSLLDGFVVFLSRFSSYIVLRKTFCSAFDW